VKRTKLAYSSEEVSRWRNKAYRRNGHSSIKNERQALAFINTVGFCLASRSNGIELPNLWDAVVEHDSTSNGDTRQYYLSYAWDIQELIPNHNSVYYGKVFKRKPSIISREFFPYFYALSERTGAGDEYKTEFKQGKLSSVAKDMMDILTKGDPISAKELRSALEQKGRGTENGFDRALDELQRKMFICRVVGERSKFSSQWAPITKCFAAEVRKAKKITFDDARQKLLEKYFENQLVTSIESIQKVFGWSKQTIYHTIGTLIEAGVITVVDLLDGKKAKCYCLVR